MDGNLELYSSKCMHEPCFMALVPILSENNDINAKTRQNFAKSVNR